MTQTSIEGSPSTNGHGDVNGHGAVNGYGTVNGHGSVNGYSKVNGHSNSHDETPPSDKGSASEGELERLREQVAQLQAQVQRVTVERDHLLVRDNLEDRTQRLYRQELKEEGFTAKPDFGKVRGKSRAQRVEDPRIGRPKRILVIGGGPAGLVSLHELLNPVNRPDGEAMDEYHIELYERRADVGGVWYFEPENDIAKGWHHGADGLRLQAGGNAIEEGDVEGCSAADGSNGHGSGNANGGAATNGDQLTNGHVRHDSGVNTDFCYLSQPRSAPRWPSPAYEGLVGNVLRPLIEFAAEKFPQPRGGLFPSMTETHEYLLKLAAPLRPYIRTCREVVAIKPAFGADDDQAVKWEVKTVDWTRQSGPVSLTETWDAIVVAAGAFDHPYWPTIPGLAALRERRSPLVMHAKTYPGPRPFLNQHNKFVVVGNANSANDIAAHLAPLNSAGPLYRCVRHESNFAHLPDSRIRDVPPIASIRDEGDTLALTLTDGTLIAGVTKLIFASGYEFAFEWLTVPSVKDGEERSRLVASSVHGAVPNLHNATFHAVAPTLAFIGLSTGSTPMPLAEIQARIAARTFHGLVQLPPTKEAMLRTFQERAREVGVDVDEPERDAEKWRTLHMIRGPVERVLTRRLLEELEANERGASEGLFRWDEWREGVIATMRKVKEAELARLRDARIAAGGVDGGVGGILSHPAGGPPPAVKSLPNGVAGASVAGKDAGCQLDD